MYIYIYIYSYIYIYIYVYAHIIIVVTILFDIDDILRSTGCCTAPTAAFSTRTRIRGSISITATVVIIRSISTVIIITCCMIINYRH